MDHNSKQALDNQKNNQKLCDKNQYSSLRLKEGLRKLRLQHNQNFIMEENLP